MGRRCIEAMSTKVSNSPVATNERWLELEFNRV